MIMAAMIRITASGSVIRAPYSTRENTSRPSSSVPNQCADDGGARMAKFCASGLSGAISGAKIAITTQAPITPRPARASGRRHGTGVTGRSRRRRATAATASRRIQRSAGRDGHDSLIRGSMTP